MMTTNTQVLSQLLNFSYGLLDLKGDSLVLLGGRGFVWSVRVGEECQRDLAEGGGSDQIADVCDLTELLWKQFILLPRHLDVLGGVDSLLPHAVDVEPVALVAVNNLMRERKRYYYYA